MNAPTQRGEAGAPLLNMKGEVVGIVVSGLENNSACYAVPIEAAEKIRSDFVRFGEARHGWIGVNQLSEAPKPAAGSRVEITQVVGIHRQLNLGSSRATFSCNLGRKR